jgi:hypothetical protein
MGNYDKYICTKLYKRENLPGPTPAQRDTLAAEGWRISMEHILWIDSDVIPGAYYGESTYIWPLTYPNQIDPKVLARRYNNARPMFPHAHDFPEILSWWGTDPDHPEDTTSMGMIMEDEEITLDKSWVAYIPAGMQHMPTRTPEGRISSKPVIHWTSGPGTYTRETDHAPKAEKKAKTQAPPKQTEIKRGSNLKNEKYFVYGYKKGVKRPSYMSEMNPRYSRPVAYIDQTIIPDAEFGCDTWWLLPGDTSKAGQMIFDKRTLPHGTSITLTAMNYADITDLAGEAELWIGGEKHIIRKNFGAYIPPDLEAGPLIVRNLTQQTFLMMSFPVGEGIKKYRGGK